MSYNQQEETDEYLDYVREASNFGDEEHFDAVDMEEDEANARDHATTLNNTNNSAQQQQQQQIKSDRIKYIGAIIICLLAHILFGFQPPFSRYLQKTAKIPTLSLIFTSNFLALVLYSPRWIYLLLRTIRRRLIAPPRKGTGEDMMVDELRNNTTDNNNNNDDNDNDNEGGDDVDSSSDDDNDDKTQQQQQEQQTRSTLRTMLYYVKHYGIYVLFGVALCLRTSTNILSTKYTKAINVQMVASTTPFLVSILSLGIINRFLPESQREKWTVKSLVAMVVTVIGGLMIILGGSVEKPPAGQSTNWYDFLLNYRIAWKSISSEMTTSDLIGIGITFISNCALAIYMVCLRFMKQAGLKMSEEGVYLYQEAILTCVFFIPALIVDDWHIWLTLKPYDWLIFVSFSVCIYVGGNIFNIIAIQALGPSTTGSIFALRLVSTIIFGGVLIGEWFKSVWQLVGSVIVISAVTYFLWVQNKAKNGNVVAGAAQSTSNHPLTATPTDAEMELLEEGVSTEPVDNRQ